MKTYKGIDLFAGIGGIRLGFDKAFGDSIQTIFVSEWDEKAQKTYKSNFSKDDIEIAGDITQIDEKDVPSFDICMAGFPCQSFSVGGKREGFNDNYHGICRGTLFLDVARICDYHKPKVIFCENVKGLVTHDKKRTFQIIKKTFEDIGYKVFYKILDSKNFGVAQHRERVYIVCFRNDIAPETFTFPTGCGETVKLKDILEDNVPIHHYLSQQYINSLQKRQKRHKEKGNGFNYEPLDINGVSNTIVCGGSGHESNLIVDHKNINNPNPKGKEINSGHIRKMTPREWARLQGFDDSYVFPCADTITYKQLGNSVTVPVIEAIAEKIKEVLNKKKYESN